MRITQLSNNTVKEYDLLRNRIVSNKGGWIIGKGVFNQGYSMLDELVGKISYFQLLIFNITGKLVSENLAKWIEAFYQTVSWPDPRIWCNQIAALAGTAKTGPVSAIAAGVLASDSKLYGPGVIEPIAKFLIETESKRSSGEDLVELLEKYLANKRKKVGDKAVVIGFSRPIATGDERVPILKNIARELDLVKGAHEILAENIHNYVHKKYAEGINVGGFVAALLVDQGFNIKEIYRLTTFAASAGIHACYAEYFDKPENHFLPMRCEDIEYNGPAPRNLTSRCS
jgi:hypothetical protein